MSYLKRKLLIKITLFLLPVVLFFSLLLMVIVIVTSTFAVSNNASTVNACGNNTSESSSSQSGSGLSIPIDKIETVKSAFNSLNNWDGSTRSNPAKNGSVSADFNKLDSVHTEAHNGVDLASTGGALAIIDGVVVANTFNSARGNLIAIAFKDKDGKAMTYEYQHLASSSKNIGDIVKAGEQVGIIGNTGVGTGVHLHIEVEIASLKDGLPTWVGTYPTNPNIMFDVLSYFNLPREFSSGPSSAFGDIGDNSNQTGERCSSSGLITSLEGNSNAEKAYKFFREQGFSKEGSAGIVGNLMVESGINPLAGEVGGNGGGRGIAQWGQGGIASNGASAGSRWNSLEEWAKTQNMNPDDLVTQLNFLVKEMRDYQIFDYYLTVSVLYTEPTGSNPYGGGAVGYFAEKFEKPSVSLAHMDKRNNYAIDALAKFN